MFIRVNRALVGLAIGCSVLAAGSTALARPKPPATAPAQSKTPATVSSHKQADDVRNQEDVYYADLNIANERGRATFLRRVQAAIDKVCSPETQDLTALATQRECVTAAWQNANPQINEILAQATKNQSTVDAIKLIIASTRK